ncbi:MAG: metallophosphoesterase [Elusimicrobia bacterium]|nr:metallophosphoesterase [Elusimicrobiota bacterium]
MRIGILSDTHNNTGKILKAIEFFNLRQAEFVLHAGDFSYPEVAKYFEMLQCPFMAVFGNNDFDVYEFQKIIGKFGSIYEPPYEFVLDGKNFLMTHHLYTPFKKYDYIICGHTHRPSILKTSNGLIINPGEVAGRRYGRSTVATLDTEKNHAEIFDLD